jgi:glycosyltransferase involved in cell wall biosynthesis
VAIRSPRVGIVIPCFNEEKNIPDLFQACEQAVINPELEFILVDNGSTDKTFYLMKEQSKNARIRYIHLENNMGYGGGILAGLKDLNNEYMGWSHADLQTPLTDINHALALFGYNFDYIKGLRARRKLLDELFTIGMSGICSVIFRKQFWDINAQPTIFKRDLFAEWVYPPQDFSLDLYSFVKARELNYSVKRFNVTFYKRVHGQSTWNFGLKSRVSMSAKTLKYAAALSRRKQK